MTQFIIVAEDEATDPKVQAVYGQIRRELGFGIVPNLFKSMALNPDLLEANWLKFRAIVLRGNLPRTLKEMIGVVISQANKSEYALRVHLHGLSVLGISEEVLKLLVEDFERCPLPGRQKAAIQFGLRAGTMPSALTDVDYQQLYTLGLSQPEVFEIVTTANLFADVNQYTEAIALEIDQL